jgi:hypothetical protein
MYNQVNKILSGYHFRIQKESAHCVLKRRGFPDITTVLINICLFNDRQTRFTARVTLAQL